MQQALAHENGTLHVHPHAPDALSAYLLVVALFLFGLASLRWRGRAAAGSGGGTSTHDRSGRPAGDGHDHSPVE